MIRKILYTRPDGGVSIVQPVRNTVGEVPGITDAEIEQRAFAKLPADAINSQFIDLSAIPADRTFRNAWRQNGATVQIDLPAARAFMEKRIEEQRRIKIRDVLEREALGENVSVEKASIRAINARALVDAAQTPEELKVVMPAVLIAVRVN